MKILIGLLLTLFIILPIFGAGMSDYYDNVLGTALEVPDPWYIELRFYLASGVSLLLACVLIWFQDRVKYRRGEQTTFPIRCLFFRG